MNFKKLGKKKLITLIAIFGTCLLLASVYLGGFLYYSYHFLPKTTISGIDVSGNSLEEANAKLKELAPRINIIEKDELGKQVIEAFPLAKLGDNISYDASALLNSQDKIAWFLPKESNVPCNKITGSYVKARIKSLIRNFYFLNKEHLVLPEDAHLAIKDRKVVVEEETEGNFIEEKTVINLINQAVLDLLEGKGSDTLDLGEYYEKPSLTKDDPSFSGKTSQYQPVLDKTLRISFPQDQVIELKEDELCDLLSFEGSKMSVNQDQLSSYIYQLDQGKGKELSIIIDRADLQKQLQEKLLSDKEESIDVQTLSEAPLGVIDVDIPNQILHYYENDTLILTSPVVSGNKDITDETPHGEFYIRRMSTDSYLMGRDYLEHVDYWMGFDPSGRVYGLHDAQWRDEFGGDIYTYDPSRGCVNMPIAKITILFHYAREGTKVIIHD